MSAVSRGLSKRFEASRLAFGWAAHCAERPLSSGRVGVGWAYRCFVYGGHMHPRPGAIRSTAQIQGLR